MKDFLTRVAERALGTAPRVDPQVTSRYAPARLPLPELQAPLSERPASRPVSRARQIDREHELPTNVMAPSLEPARQAEERINAPEQPRKFDRFPLPPEAIPPVTELEPEPEFTPEKIIMTSVGPPESHDPQSHPASVLSTHAENIDHVSDEIDSRDEVTHPRIESVPVRAASSVDNKLQVQPQTRTLKIVERIVDESNEIEDAVEPSSPPPVEVVTRSREHQQPARAAVSPIVAPPTSTSDHRRDDRHDRPERRENSIRVKIGRVEVHAPPPPVTPVEPPAAPVPKLSLAEFLRQHNRRRDE